MFFIPHPSYGPQYYLIEHKFFTQQTSAWYYFNLTSNLDQLLLNQVTIKFYQRLLMLLNTCTCR